MITDTHKMLQRTSTMTWEPSPSPSVMRKRLELVGPKEAGRVTSVVVYLPDSKFKIHEHPDGEEILVLDGVFSDHSGDYPTGTFILNPEGFSHAPKSKGGCVLFVKLRQYPGLQRRQVRVDTKDESNWKDEPQHPGVRSCTLYRDIQGESYGEMMDLLKLTPGASVRIPAQKHGVELFVVEGEHTLTAGGESLSMGDWLKLIMTNKEIELKNTSESHQSIVYLKQNHINKSNM